MSGVRLPDGFLEELKARLRPSDVIGRTVKLQRRGKEWVGLSPFTNEKTPSFYVNDQKGIFKDFSSGMGGDVIKFVQETERLDFMEAVARLADEAGLDLPKATPEEAQREGRRTRLKAACAEAANWFEARLHGQAGLEAQSYLRDRRGLGPDAWRRWRLGHAPNDWRQLREHMLQKGFTDEELADAGLVRRSDKGGEPYDVFRNRIMFPIADGVGDIVAFGGRALDPEDKAKYLNSPETELFHKSRLVYNLKKAREALGYGERGGLIVCEGYMDVIALGEAGFGNAVAPLGTALTEAQLALIWRAGPDPVMCFDGDVAGLRAAHRAVELALPHLQPDRSVYFCLLPEGRDPDDVLRQPGGRDHMAARLGEAIALSEMLWRRERDAEPLDTPERQAGLEDRLQKAAARIQHAGVRAAYERSLRQRMRDHFFAMRRERQGERLAGRRGGPEGARNASRSGLTGDADARLRMSPKVRGLGLLVRAANNPHLIDHHGETLAEARFPDPDIAAARDALFDLYDRSEALDRVHLSAHLRQSGKERVARLLDEYPDPPTIQPGSAEAREWLIALEQYAAAGRADRPDGPGPCGEDAFATLEDARWRYQRAAERRARQIRMSEAAQDADRTDQGSGT